MNWRWRLISSEKHLRKPSSDKKHKVKCYHQQCIKALGKNMTAIAHDNKGNIEAFKHDKHPIYGVVWHPERMKNPVLPNEVKKLLD